MTQTARTYGEALYELALEEGLTAQLQERELGEKLLIPCNMLKADEDIFLDDYTVKQVSDALQVPVVIVKSSGQDLIDAVVDGSGK